MDPLTTERLVLVPVTLERVRAEIDDSPRLWRELDAAPPPAWPPPLNDDNSRRWTLAFLEQHADGVGWGPWYFLLREGRVPVGQGGFCGLPREGTVEVGYSILEPFQGRGLASEALRALIGWASGQPAVERIVAQTLPELAASIRVLEKCGFHAAGPGFEEGAVLYEYGAGV